MPKSNKDSRHAAARAPRSDRNNPPTVTYPPHTKQHICLRIRPPFVLGDCDVRFHIRNKFFRLRTPLIVLSPGSNGTIFNGESFLGREKKFRKPTRRSFEDPRPVLTPSSPSSHGQIQICLKGLISAACTFSNPAGTHA